MDYLCAKFGDFSLSRFGFTVRTVRQTEEHACYTHTTTVGVSNNMIVLAKSNVIYDITS